MKAQLAVDAPMPADQYIYNDNWWLEQKIDGQRFLIRIVAGIITAFNRHGIVMTLPGWLADELSDGTFNQSQWEFDGELLDGHYYVFDCMYVGNEDIRSKPLTYRRGKLENIFTLWNPGPRVTMTTVARTSEEKDVLYGALYHNNAEGAVAKKWLSSYTAGKKVKHLLKLKFVTDCDVEVMELDRDGKPLAITVGCVGADGKIVEVSGCKVPLAVREQLKVGDVITVNYLYATDDNKLTQPTFKCVRNDTTADTVESLKHTSKEVL